MKKFLSLLLIVFVVAYCMPVFAEGADGEITVSVEISNTQFGPDAVRITVLSELDEGWLSVYLVDKNEKVIDVQQQRAGAENIFEMEIWPDNAADTYTAVVGLNSDAKSIKTEKTFKYYSYAAQQTAISNILYAADAVTEIENSKDVLFLKLDGIYAEVTDKTVITNKLVPALKQRLADGETVGQEEFAQALEEYSYLAFINEGKTSNIEKAIKQYSAEYGIDTGSEEYGWYQKCEEKQVILNAMIGADYDEQIVFESTEAFAERFDEVNYLYRLSKEHYLNAEGFLRKYNHKYPGLNLDFISFDTLLKTTAKKEYAMSLIASKLFEGFDKLTEAFNNAITEAEDYQPTVPSEDEGKKPAQSIVVTSPGIAAGNSGAGGIIPSSQPVNNTEFSDISNVPWASEAIISLAEDGIINGVGNKRFEPDGTVTREQFVKMIVGALEIKGDADISKFDDIAKGEWYCEFLSAAVANEIIMGISENAFGVGSPVSRQDMSVIIYRAMKKCGIELLEKTDELPTDTDSVSDYAREAVEALYKAGIVNGMGDGRFAAGENATRAQAAKIIYEVRRLWKK